MNLPKATPLYDPDDQRSLRLAISNSDDENLKRGRDFYLVRGERLFRSSLVGIVAHAGGGQGSATAMTHAFNQIDTCATAADSVKALPAKAGMDQVVSNATAAAAQLFGSNTDTINGVATGTGISIPAGKTVYLFAMEDTKWRALVGA